MLLTIDDFLFAVLVLECDYRAEEILVCVAVELVAVVVRERKEKQVVL
jgi:hypothetical protein